MAESEQAKSPNVQKLWNIAKGLGMVLAMAGGGYGTFGTADEGAVRGAMTETLDEIEDLRDQITELRQLRDKDRHQWEQFLMNRSGGELPAMVPVDMLPEPPAMEHEGAVEQRVDHVKKARSRLRDL